MDKVEYDLDTSGGLMEEIQALIAPPQSDDSKKKQSNKEAATNYRHSKKTANRDTCDACKEDGDLLCCDICPASFHLLCCDPPLEDEDVPTGEWICNECKFGITKKSDMKQNNPSNSSHDKKESSLATCPNPAVLSNPKLKPFEKLTKIICHKNPREFDLPVFLQDFTVMPGDRKRRTPIQAKKKEEESQRLCFICSKSSRIGNLIYCDFCPLVFHCDCLTPPLAQEPIGLWICPNHPENFEPKIRTPRFSERAQVIEELKTKINHNAIILDFVKRAKKERILMNRKNHQPKCKRVSIVPDIVKAQYKNPPAELIPNIHIDANLKPHMKPIVMPTEREKEEWLSAVIDLQCSIASALEHTIAEKPEKQDTEDVSSSEKEIIERDSAEQIIEEECNLPDDDTAIISSSADTIDEEIEGQSTPNIEQESMLPDSTSCNENIQRASLESQVSSSSLICTESNLDSPEKMDVVESPNIDAQVSTENDVVFIAQKNENNLKEEMHFLNSLEMDLTKDPMLLKLDERLLRVLAYQRIQQLMQTDNEELPKVTHSDFEEKKILTQVVETKMATAVLSPLNSIEGYDVYLRHGSFNIGTGGDVDLHLPSHGFCNYVSGKHATIFFDKESAQYELLNYSEHGTIVDNVLYSCDFSEKSKPNIISSTAQYDEDFSSEYNRKPPIGRTTKEFGVEYITKACDCRASASSLIGDSGAGWEGSAILHHGSYLKFGCLHFLFSIVDCANVIPATENKVDT